ncbi:phosphate ABC transporter substrate-binding protein PstS [Streptomyces purpurogeneiscleroticus]|uniref:phosphate ABC transporter substrate-binding protein PstS n=1 Tax=Streptomyces purpurogeneiscleroticus TaxID=68259 RepID=UPI001CBB9484|nr:phosphate ABC transporter substrate-binding protein PstS [Streptomyces purpurogeneiscleroticus]MBZ4014723.1 phosphate ABC transporter substrate-binding protein PstS [Streptomyces purpurogeneiscleroticus]
MRRTSRWGTLLAGACASTLLLSGCGAQATDQADQHRRPAEPVPTGVDCAGQGKARGSGSTAQQSAMEHWIDAYQRACPSSQIAYNPLGSGAGIAQFQRGATAFGATDGVLSKQEIEWSREVCRGGRAIHLPMAGGPVAIGFHLPGVENLVLDAPTLAKIFDSRITTWDAPAIKKLNPGTKLPSLPIRPMHRSDDSGTTQNFQEYLAGAAPEQWPHPAGKAWEGKGGGSATGSTRVAAEVASSEGTIGYFELSSAVSRKITTVSIDTGAGEPVAPTTETASAGIGAADIVGEGNDKTLAFDYDAPKPGAYPIVLMTYEVVCDKGNQAASLPVLKSFLSYTASAEGQKHLAALHYAPLPDAVATEVRRAVRTLS